MNSTQDRCALDIAIIGAPKCGTSSLFSWLAQHPGINPSQPKESYYFIDQDHPMRGTSDDHFDQSGWPGFDKFFESKDGLRLEASVHNLYQQTALDAFSTLSPCPLTICVLRDPAEQIRSSFYFAKNNFGRVDDVLTFSAYTRALLSGDTEVLKRYIQDDQVCDLLASSLDTADYVRWLKPWARQAEKHKLMLIDFRQLSSQPERVVNRVLDAAGLEQGLLPNDTFQAKNRTIHFRNPQLHSIARGRGSWLPTSLRNYLQQIYRRWQVQPRHLPNQQEAKSMELLHDYFKPSLAALHAEFGLTLL